MIEVIQAPGANRFLADGNDTDIIIKSTRGNNYYFQIDIYINGILLTTQSWSKDAQGKATHNLRKLYDVYFNTVFAVPSIIEVTYLTELQRKVRIVVKENEIKTGRTVEKFVLPEYYIIKNRVPYFFMDTNDLQLLDYEVPEIYVPENGLVIFPFYSNGKNDFVVEITDIGTNTILMKKSYTGKNSRIFQFNLLLEFLGLNLGTSSLKIIFKSGNGIIEKRIQLIRRSIYPIKQVFHLNNFGFFLCSYLRGKLEIANNLKPKSYIDATGNTVTYDIEETYQVELNSGYSYFNELSEMIATSLDVRLNFNGQWNKMTAETKKVTVVKDNEFIKQTTLKFSKKNIDSLNNMSTYNSAPTAVNIIVQGEENVSLRFPVSKFIDAFSDQDDELKSILITQPTKNGNFGYFKKSGEYVSISPNGGVLSSITVLILLSEADYFEYDPYTDRFGSPLDIINFQLNDGSFNSNTAKLIFNIEEGINAPIPPSITVQSNYQIITDASGRGEVTVPITVNNPDGFPITVVWSKTSPKLSLSNTTNNSGKISVLNAINGEQFYVKVKVTDSRGLSSEKTVTFKAVNRQIQLTSIVIFESPVVSFKEFDIKIFNGIAFQSIGVQFNFSSSNNNGFSEIFINGFSSQLFLNRTNYSSYQKINFDSNGSIIFSVRVAKDRGELSEGGSQNSSARLLVEIRDPSPGMSINPGNSILSLIV
ncbi:hypothetical protein ACE939_00940 [Aquimarina sp. W85]|uniref:hypothetical protein n=1 Tax=Aquimarina rhodophyticola TaxID=3342246 RepID=UPI00367316D8